MPVGVFLRNRHKVSFSTRSPFLISLGLVCILGDCIMNTYIYAQSNENYNWKRQCNAGILLTITVFNGTLLIYFVRMYRIFKVFKYYAQYLAMQKEEAEKEFNQTEDLPFSVEKDFSSVSEVNLLYSRDSRLSARISALSKQQDEERVYLSQMKNCSESYLLRKGCLYFMLPLGMLGILGIFFPYVYVFVPSYDSNECICAFYLQA